MATIRPVASYFELSKSSTLKRGIDAWFDMFEASFLIMFLNELIELWYSNFTVTRGTFTYILHEVVDEMFRQDTPMRKAVRGHS